jgi:tRNA nucleotidyltransferase (CCA-adding enzyme)
MKTYVVGGAVRDELLGLPVRDRDHVVVGASPEDMLNAGFRPVGKDFPVFLHPDTQEEYALARTERKTGPGYKGFAVHAAPDVTLEDDLRRRDLTINAMARGDDGALIDPYGGERDLHARLLRHVSPAFAEDPVRILRVARFAARFDFRVADETLGLMRRMVEEGEADALVPERVWQEFSKGLMEPYPVRLFQVLACCGLLDKLCAECALAFDGDAPEDDRTRAFVAALDWAAKHNLELPERFALLALFMPPGADAGALEAMFARLRTPNDCRDAALLALHQGAAVVRAPIATAEQRLAVLEASDAFRRPARLQGLLATCAAAQFGAGQLDEPWPSRAVLHSALDAARGVDAAAVAAQATAAQTDIAAALRRARAEAIAAVVKGGA